LKSCRNQKRQGGECNGHDPIGALRIGLIGSGFIANFHLQPLINTRHVAVTGAYGPTPELEAYVGATVNGFVTISLTMVP
jgi:hypothetical protein